MTREMAEGPVPLPPMDRHARDRIEVVAQRLLALSARLEERLVAVEARIADVEDALTQLGMVQVPR